MAQDRACHRADEVIRITYDPLRRVHIETWNPWLCFLTTRFYPHEIRELHALLNLADVVVLDNRCVEDGVSALAILLACLAVPSRHFDISSIFGRERSIIGRIVCHVQAVIYTNWKHLLKWNPRRLTPERLEVLAEALVEEKNCPLSNCVGYIDSEDTQSCNLPGSSISLIGSCGWGGLDSYIGTVWNISRPQVLQRVFYNGHKLHHALKFQAVTCPE